MTQGGHGELLFWIYLICRRSGCPFLQDKIITSTLSSTQSYQEELFRNRGHASIT